MKAKNLFCTCNNENLKERALRFDDYFIKIFKICLFVLIIIYYV